MMNYIDRYSSMIRTYDRITPTMEWYAYCWCFREWCERQLILMWWCFWRFYLLKSWHVAPQNSLVGFHDPIWLQAVQLPETNSQFAPEDRPKRPKEERNYIVFQPSMFRCELLAVSFREGKTSKLLIFVSLFLWSPPKNFLVSMIPFKSASSI